MAIGTALAIGVSLGAAYFGNKKAERRQKEAEAARRREIATATVESYGAWNDARKRNIAIAEQELANMQDDKNLQTMFGRAGQPAVDTGGAIIKKVEGTTPVATLVVPIIAALVIAAMIKM